MAGADTQYLIDIATKLSGSADATSALADLGARMTETGASAQALDAAVMAAKAGLAETGAAASAAAGAVAEAQAAYNANEVAADRAAKAAERLGNDVTAAAAKMASMRDAETGELGAGYLAAASKLQQLSARQEEAQGKASALAGALQEEGAALDALKAKASEAEAAHEQLAGGIGALEDGAQQAAALEESVGGSGKVNELGEAFGKLGGPVGAAGQQVFGMVQGMSKLSGSLGAGVGAVVGLTVVVVALAAAMIAGVVAITRWAVGLADANRNAALATQALEVSDSAFAGLGKTMSTVADQTGLTGDQLTGLAKKLRDAKVSAADMPAALKAAALAEAALGQGGADDLVQSLKDGKKTAGALAQEMQSKFGGIVAKKMLSLDAQAAKLKSNLGETFGGLNIEGLLGGLAKLVGLLDSSSASGKAIKWLFESMFQPLIDGVTAAFPSIERFFLGIILGALKMYNAFKPAIRAIGELVGASSEGEGSFDWLAAGETVIYAVAVVFGLLAAAVVAAAYPFIALYDAAMGVYEGLMAIDFAAIGDAILGVFEGVDLASAGSALIDGLVAGILGGMSSVIGAVTSIGDAAINAAESALGIASPSKVFGEIGDNTVAGYVGSVEGGTADARSALEGMVEPPAAGAPGAGAAGGAGGKSVQITIQKIEVSGVKGAENIVPDLGDALAAYLEGKMMQSGGGMLAGATG